MSQEPRPNGKAPPFRRVSPAFWAGELANQIRGDAHAIAVAFYLMTNPAANDIGVYRIPLVTVADDLGFSLDEVKRSIHLLSGYDPRCLDGGHGKGIGSPSEGHSKGMARGFRPFSLYDFRHRMVFVVEMARHEYGEHPNPRDKRVVSIQNRLTQFAAMGRNSFVWNEFRERYRGTWGGILEPLDEALPKPLPSPSEGDETNKNKNKNKNNNKKTKTRGRAEALKRVDIDEDLSAAGITPEMMKPATREGVVLKIPEELQAVVMPNMFAERMRILQEEKAIKKSPETWMRELGQLSAALREFGASAVVEAYGQATRAPWQGIEKRYVAKIAADLAPISRQEGPWE